MDAARSLDNVAIALPTAIYVLAIIATTSFNPGQGARVSKHLTSQIVSVRIDRAATQRDTFRKTRRRWRLNSVLLVGGANSLPLDP